MHKTVAALGLSLGLLLGQTAYVSAETPDAVIELSGGSVAAGVGFSWGSGTLIYQGKRYPLKISGFSLASVGVTEYAAAGTVSGLKTPRDINGVYAAAAAGGTLGGGGGASAMTNQSGVTIQMTSTSEGLNLTLATEGVKIRLAE
jgi:hypothetical protein